MSEAIIEPDLPIIDPHHHLWDWRSRVALLPPETHGFDAILRQSPRYLLDDMIEDVVERHRLHGLAARGEQERGSREVRGGHRDILTEGSRASPCRVSGATGGRVGLG